MMKALSHYAPLLVALTACNAFASENWTSISTNSPNITFALDKGSVQRKKNVVTFWEKLVYATPEVKDEASGKMIKEKKVRRVMNCKKRTQGYNYGVTYAEGGGFITSISLDDAQVTMGTIPPGSIAEEELHLVCQKVEKTQ